MIIAGIGFYMALMLVIGIVAARRAGGYEDFAVAGRRLPLSITTATLFATWMGAGTILGAAGTAAEEGFLGVIADPFGAGLALLLAGTFVVRMLRRMRVVSVLDLMGQRFGAFAMLLGSVGLLITYVGWSAAQFVAFGFTLHVLTGLDVTLGIWIGTLVVLLYTATGGMWAVALTDFVQMIFVVAGVGVLAYTVTSTLGGVGLALDQAAPGAFRLIPETDDAATWLAYLRDWASMGIGSMVAQDLLQRTFAAKTERIAVNACWLSGLGYLTIGVVPAVIGIVGAHLVPGLEDPEYLIPELAMRYLGPVALTLFLGALLAAIMSSADSALLAASNITSSNILSLVRPDADDALRLRVARVSIPVLGLFALLVGLELQTVFDLMVDAIAAIMVVMVAPVMAALYWPRVNNPGAVAGMIAGYGLWMGLPWVSDVANTDFIGFLGNIVVMVLVSLATARKHPPKPLKDRHGAILPLQARIGLPG